MASHWPGASDERVNLAAAARRPRFSLDALVGGLRLGSPVLVAALLLLWALTLRTPVWGNPLLDHDDEFYLLVGDRMLHGVLPYVDIWDRKPVGLFVIYAAIRLFGGEGVVQYQLAGCAFAVLTALVIWTIAKKLAGPVSALAAAIVFLTYSVVFDGAGGQSPIFYNLLVALAALALLRLQERGASRRGIVAAGCGVMLLVGLAIQIKYTVVFEGLFFGLVLAGLARTALASRAQTAGAMALWVVSAMLPTLAATAVYAMLGHFDAFAQANFISVFYRHEAALPAAGRLAATAALLTPLLYCAVRGYRREPIGDVWPKAFVVGWCAAAIAGYLVFGTYYDHYALPVLVPLSILGALGFSAPGAVIGARFTLGFALVAAVVALGVRIHVFGSQRELAALTQSVRDNLHGCLFVYEGEPILYKSSDACLVSKFVFPSHLNAAKERGALGVDPVRETQRILARRPSVIVIADRARPGETNFATRRLVLAALASDYRLADAVQLGVHRWLVYRLGR
jgi:hypothetical protein